MPDAVTALRRPWTRSITIGIADAAPGAARPRGRAGGIDAGTAAAAGTAATPCAAGGSAASSAPRTALRRSALASGSTM
eukprot:2265879-Prymnesium_polylepis.1